MVSSLLSTSTHYEIINKDTNSHWTPIRKIVMQLHSLIQFEAGLLIGWTYAYVL